MDRKDAFPGSFEAAIPLTLPNGHPNPYPLEMKKPRFQGGNGVSVEMQGPAFLDSSVCKGSRKCLLSVLRALVLTASYRIRSIFWVQKIGCTHLLPGLEK
jgi:hypothetical protein